MTVGQLRRGQRLEALPVLVRHFLNVYGDRLGRPHIRLSPAAQGRLNR